MSKSLQRRLVFHGGIVTLLGMLCGGPLAAVLLGYMPGNADDWTLAHMEGLVNGLLMLAVAACSSLLLLSDRQYKLLLWSLVITGYGNALYGWVRGLFSVQGLDFSPPLSNQLAAILGGVPVIFAFIAIALVIFGAYKQLDDN